MKLSEGTAAWLRYESIEAQTLEGGFRRFIDPAAVFPFVPPTAVAERFNATPFDIEGVF